MDLLQLEPLAVTKRELIGGGLLEHEVLGDGHVSHEAHLVAVLGDVTQAGVDEGLGREDRNLRPLGTDDLAGIRPYEAGHDLSQRRLAVAVDARNAEDLALVDGERDVLQATMLNLGMIRDSLEDELVLGGTRDLLVGVFHELLANHEVCQLLLGGVHDAHGLHGLSAAQDRDAV